jgi:hypothetical protein
MKQREKKVLALVSVAWWALSGPLKSIEMLWRTLGDFVLQCSFFSRHFPCTCLLAVFYHYKAVSTSWNRYFLLNRMFQLTF